MIQVCLVDDQTLVRQGIRSLLELSDSIRVIAEAGDGVQAVETIPRVKPDVVLLDMRMPGLSGLDDRAAIVAPRIAGRRALQHAGGRLAPRRHRLPMRVLVLVEDVLRSWEGRDPPATAEPRVPAAMVEVEMGAEDVGDIFESEARGVETVEPRSLGEVVRRRIALVLAGAGVDEDRVFRRSHEEGLVGDDHLAARRIEHGGIELGEMPASKLRVVSREHRLGRAPRAVALDEARDDDVADGEGSDAFLPDGL